MKNEEETVRSTFKKKDKAKKKVKWELVLMENIIQLHLPQGWRRLAVLQNKIFKTKKTKIKIKK